MVEELSRPFDLAVVGAGMVGAAAAVLARLHAPDPRILVLEQARAGSGASLYSAGLDVPWARDAARRRLMEESGALWPRLRRAGGVSIRRLSCFAVEPKGEAQAALDGLCHAARPATPAQRAALAAAVPQLALGPGRQVLSVAGARQGMPGTVASRLAAAAVDAPGSVLWEGTRVDAVRPGEEGYDLSLADGRRVRARRVLVATGPWLGGPAAGAARAAGVRVKKVAALHLDHAPPPDAPAVLFNAHDAFLLPLPERRQWLFSFTSREWDCEPDPGRLHIGAADRALALEVLARVAPGLVDRAGGGRVFCDAYAPDRLPVVAECAPGLVVAGACAGSGFRLAPAIAAGALRRLGIDLSGIDDPDDDPEDPWHTPHLA